MKPTLIDLSSSDYYVERRFSRHDLKTHAFESLYVGVSVAGVGLFLLFLFGIPITLFGCLVFTLPFILSGLFWLPSCLYCKALTPEGVFMTHRSGRVLRSILWEDIDSVAYQIIPLEEGYTFKVKANPKEGKSIVFKTMNPKAAAILYVALFQQSRQGAQTLEHLVARGVFTAGEPSQFEGFVIQFAAQRIPLHEIQKKILE